MGVNRKLVFQPHTSAPSGQARGKVTMFLPDGITVDWTEQDVTRGRAKVMASAMSAQFIDKDAPLLSPSRRQKYAGVATTPPGTRLARVQMRRGDGPWEDVISGVAEKDATALAREALQKGRCDEALVLIEQHYWRKGPTT